MGFSVTIASSIVLIGIIVSFGSLSWATYWSVKTISKAADDYMRRERERLDVSVTLVVDSLGSRNCNITVKNTGSSTLFFKDQNGFKWNSICVSYSNDSKWCSYAIEDYLITKIKVSNSEITFETSSHPFLSSGEEASIYADLPEEAPDIAIGAVVYIVFVTHYGVSARMETVRQQ